MCGRFTYKLTWAEIVKLYRLTLDQPPRNTQPRYNICPTTTIDTIVSLEGKRSLVPLRWGLIPGWWSKPLKEMKLATFNARAETVATKPMFRDAFKSKRLLIPASGYYEWHDALGGKQPYYFTRRDGQPITIAGLWSNWKDREAANRQLSGLKSSSTGDSHPRGVCQLPTSARCPTANNYCA
jgi:putative SOS response-associated peptidase YedK